MSAIEAIMSLCRFRTIFRISNLLYIACLRLVFWTPNNKMEPLFSVRNMQLYIRYRIQSNHPQFTAVFVTF